MAGRVQTIGERLAPWIDASRPRTLAASLGPVIMGTTFVMSDPQAPHRWWRAVLVVVGAVSIQVACNFANDALDALRGADGPGRLGPKRAVASGLISARAMLGASAAAAGIGLMAALVISFEAGWQIAALGAVSVLLAYAYTAGPAPLAYVGLGEAFVLVFFGPVAAAGTVFALTSKWSALAAVAGLAPGFLSTAILSINNLRDVAGDSQAGKRTLAVRMGSNFARWEYIYCLLAAATVIVGVTAEWGHPLACAGIIPIALLAGRSARVLRGAHSQELNAVLGATGQALLGSAILFSVGWWLS